MYTSVRFWTPLWPGLVAALDSILKVPFDSMLSIFEYSLLFLIVQHGQSVDHHACCSRTQGKRTLINPSHLAILLDKFWLGSIPSDSLLIGVQLRVEESRSYTLADSLRSQSSRYLTREACMWDILWTRAISWWVTKWLLTISARIPEQWQEIRRKSEGINPNQNLSKSRARWEGLIRVRFPCVLEQQAWGSWVFDIARKTRLATCKGGKS